MWNKNCRKKKDRKCYWRLCSTSFPFINERYGCNCRLFTVLAKEWTEPTLIVLSTFSTFDVFFLPNLYYSPKLL
jgi:hypothetical protein